MHDHDELAANHKRIWLQPICQVDERSWCEDPQPCDDCDMPPVEYIRVDVAQRIAEMAYAVAGPYHVKLSQQRFGELLKDALKTAE